MTVLWILIGILVGIAAGLGIAYTLLKNQLTKAGREALKKAEEDGELLKKEKILQQRMVGWILLKSEKW